MSGYWPLTGEANKLAEKGVLVDGMPQVPVVVIIIIIIIVNTVRISLFDGMPQGKEKPL